MMRPSCITQLGVLNGGAVVLEVKRAFSLLEAVGTSDGNIETSWLGFGELGMEYEVKVKLVENVPIEPGEVTLL